jgi:hypothetical protein
MRQLLPNAIYGENEVRMCILPLYLQVASPVHAAVLTVVRRRTDGDSVYTIVCTPKGRRSTGHATPMLRYTFMLHFI